MLVDLACLEPRLTGSLPTSTSPQPCTEGEQKKRATSFTAIPPRPPIISGSRSDQQLITPPTLSISQQATCHVVALTCSSNMIAA